MNTWRSNFLSGLFSYSRSGPIPKQDIGFYYDLGYVLKTVNPDVAPFGYGEALTALKRHYLEVEACDLYRMLDASVINAFDEQAGQVGALLGGVVFLKLTHILRETDRLPREQLLATVGSFQSSELHRVLVQGVWWCGTYWGFTPFASLFYAALRSASQPPLPRPNSLDETPPADPDERRAWLACLAHDAKRQKGTWKKAAQLLNERGIRTISGKSWTPNNASSMAGKAKR